MMNSIMHSLVILSAATSLAVTPAIAQPKTVSVTVSFADLDLTTEAGRARLDRRILRAAAAVCSPRETILLLRADYNDCRKDAATDANTRLASLRKGDMRVQVAVRTSR